MRTLELTEELLAQLTAVERVAVEELWQRQAAAADAALKRDLEAQADRFGVKVADSAAAQSERAASRYTPRKVSWDPSRSGSD